MRLDHLWPWRPAAGSWTPAAAAHLWRRAGFGARPDDLERALVDGLEGTLERMFSAPGEGDAELRRAAEPLLAAESLELLQAWWMALILAGGAPLRERVTLLWHDLFATSQDKVDDVRLMHAQNEFFRREGLGDFRALLRGVARDPAMLVWLDGNSNRKGHPNENFAREVMELFALGIGNYDERDIQELARALTGLGTEGRATVFRAEHHDTGEKTILGSSGRFNPEEAVELVLNQPACARHVARVLLEGFVSPLPERAWIEELAVVLLEEDWNIERTLRILLASRLFHSTAARRTRIAGPVELVASAAHALDAHVPPRRAVRWASEMGQALFRPPSVKGWDGGRAWIHSGTWIVRHNALVALATAHRDDSGPIRFEAERVFPQEDALSLARAVRSSCLPENDDEELLTALSTAASSASSPARACVAALLTSPEFQLY